MNNVVDEVLAGEPRYNITDSQGNILYRNVKIDLATAITTAGTPLNKVLFDSIRADLNSRLLIANKATTAEAQTGTNDVKYMTPLKTKQAIQNLKSVQTYTTETTGTIYTFNNSSVQTIKITGAFGIPATYGSNPPTITISGTNIYLEQRLLNETEGARTTDSSHTFAIERYGVTSNSGKSPFFLEFDMATKTWQGLIPFPKTSGGLTKYYASIVFGEFDALSTLTFSKNTRVPLKVSVELGG